MRSEAFDFIIIGSGFGGSVSAMRLAEKGYRVVILEEGMEYRNQDFPRLNWNLRKYLWEPVFRCFGIQRISFLNRLMVLHGVGVGGGSLVYANTLMRPEDRIFQEPGWPKTQDWARELGSHYETASKMLGVTPNRYLAETDLVIRELSQKMEVPESFHPTQVGVFFGKSEVEVPDPYFGGEGPKRVGCNFCGSCMIGCPVGAKNTLDKNYLYFARKSGAKIFPGLRAEKIVPADQEGGIYTVTTVRSRSWLSSSGPSFRGKKVIVAAGALGTVKLLLKNRDRYRTLPHLSPRVGADMRSNGECLLGATSFDSAKNFSKGIAIGAAFHPDANTKIEGVRYPMGSGLLRFMGVPLTGEGNGFTRPLRMFFHIFSHPLRYLRLFLIRDWARSTVILLVMQSVDTKLRLRLGRSIFNFFRLGLKSEVQGTSLPSFLPVGQKAARLLGEIVDGVPQNVASEVLLQTPATAHILGGAIIGTSPNDGVIDVNHEVFSYPGLYVCDASCIPSNLAVNPSLTIAAMAERFASLFFPSESIDLGRSNTLKLNGKIS